MKKTGKELLVRVLILLIGLTIAHLGVTLFILANLGADPFNVLIQGLFRFVQKTWPTSFLTHGRVHMFVCIIIVILLIVIDRTYVKIGTLLCMVCGGPIIDFFTLIFQSLFEMFPSALFKFTMLAAGCVILAFGMTIVIESDAGTGPNDLVAVVISDRYHFKFSVTRVVTDCVFVLVGFLLGGTPGIGTIICAFLVGPVAGYFMPKIRKIIGQITGRI